MSLTSATFLPFRTPGRGNARPAGRLIASWDVDPATGRPRCRWARDTAPVRDRSFFERLGLVLAVYQLGR